MSNQKFKIWLPASKKMTHAHSILELANWNPSGFAFKKSDIFLQYTGMKDKNGVEIYEGDMIDHPRNIVELSFGSFNINGDRPVRNGQGVKIGNKYENPELLA